MLDGVQDRLQAWVHAEPGITAIEVLMRLKAIDPDRFTDKHLRTVQRAVKRGRMQAARRLILESVAAVAAGIPIAADSAAVPSAA
jgi:hypothetical protein